MKLPHDKWPPENPSPGDKWTAFWMSLLVPGTGQFWAACKDGQSPVWGDKAGTLLAGLLWLGAAVGVQLASQRLVGGFPLLGGAAHLMVALAAAVHAKRRLEPQRANPYRRGLAVRCPPPRGRAVSAQIELDFVEPAGRLWERVSDLPAFLTIDPFHDRIALMRPEPREGVDIVLHHNAFGRRLLRFGRIVRWSPGQGYAFSDLSGRGGGDGFPHVFFVQITSTGPRACKLTIDVRGKWTSRIIPTFLGRHWIHWVCREHARLLGKAL